jgi:MFS family permease
MMPLNWWFEWRKWELINRRDEQIPQARKWQGFLAGMVTAMLTPGLVGNFIGRSLYSDKERRSEVTFLTLLANLAQFLVSLLFGLLAIYYLKQTPFSIPMNNVAIPVFLILLLGIVLFLFAGKPWKLLSRIIPSMQLNEQGSKLKIPFLLLSVFRHFIFTFQFVLVLHAFGATISLELIFWIWQVYLFVTLVPSVFLGKVIIRDSIAVFVLSFAGIGMENMEIFSASFSVWVINLFIPLISALLLLKRKTYVDSTGI